ncbi:20209_t:CDS:2 [Entrophospora sp. SA101]|nr:20206_t:CDS:2 [Entrophospora sp. SA101]CAJ0916536.1 20209_t:CDS:2 [Entrophospora sp. SA101]
MRTILALFIHTNRRDQLPTSQLKEELMAGAINSIGEILRYVNINIFKKYRNGIHLLEAIEEENVFDRPIDDDTRSKWSLLYLFDSS